MTELPDPVFTIDQRLARIELLMESLTWELDEFRRERRADPVDAIRDILTKARTTPPAVSWIDEMDKWQTSDRTLDEEATCGERAYKIREDSTRGGKPRTWEKIARDLMMAGADSACSAARHFALKYEFPWPIKS